MWRSAQAPAPPRGFRRPAEPCSRRPCGMSMLVAAVLFLWATGNHKEIPVSLVCVDTPYVHSHII